MADYSQLVNSGGTIFNTAAKVAYKDSNQLAADLGTTANNIQWKNITTAPTGFDPSGYYGYTAPNTSSVSLNQLQPAQAVNVPTPNYQTTVNNASANTTAVESANKIYQDYVSQFTPQQTELDNTYADLLKSFSTLTAQNTGRQQYQLDQENQLGVPQFKQQIADLNSQILTGLAEQKKQFADYQAANQALENGPQQLASVVGTKQQELMKTFSTEQAAKSADLGLLQARQHALGGQLNTAIDLASRAVDLKYQPIEDELKVKAAQLDAIRPLLDKQEKIQANALQAKYDAEQQKISDAKAKAKENINLSLSNNVKTPFFTKPDGTVVRTNDGQEFHNPQEAFAAGVAPDFSNAPRVINIGKTQIETIGGKKYNFVFDTAGNVVQKVLLGSSGNGTPTPSTNGLTAKQLTRIKQIIASNPGEWGKAASQIDKEFVPGTATKADNLLKSAYLIPSDAISLLNNSGQPPTVEAWKAGRQQFVNDHPYDPTGAATIYDKFIKKPDKGSSDIVNPFAQ